MRAVVPLALMLIGFQALALRSSLLDAESVALGIFAVIVGLMFFMEGVKIGLMPFAENVGFQMPGKTHPTVLLAFSLLLGAAACWAPRRPLPSLPWGHCRPPPVPFRPSARPGCDNCSAPIRCGWCWRSPAASAWR